MATDPSTGRAAPPEAEATRDLYEQYAPQVFRFCVHQLGSREEAEDAVQSTFLNAFRGLKRGVVPELEAAWLFKIAHNVCLSRRRSSWRRGRIESPADFGLVAELAPAPSARADELIGLQDVLEGMPEPQRRAILLREWQGLSYREIAAELELSQSAVETLIFRARRSLASGLERPAEAPRRRLRAPAAALANLLSAAQGWLFGGSAAAVKVAATVAVVGAGTVVATAPVGRHQAPPQPAHPPAVHVVRPVPVQPVSVQPVSMQPAVPPAPPAHKARVRHAKAPKPAARSTAHATTPPPAAPAPAAPVETAPPTAQTRRPVATRGTSQEQHGKAHEAHGAAPAGRPKTHAAPKPHPPKKAAPANASAEQPSASGTHGNGGGAGPDGAPGRNAAHGNGK